MDTRNACQFVLLFTLCVGAVAQDQAGAIFPEAIEILEVEGVRHVVTPAGKHLRVVQEPAAGEAILQTPGGDLRVHLEALLDPRVLDQVLPLVTRATVVEDRALATLRLESSPLLGAHLAGHEALILRERTLLKVELPSTFDAEEALARLQRARDAIGSQIDATELTPLGRQALRFLVDLLPRETTEDTFLTPDLARDVVLQTGLQGALPSTPELEALLDATRACTRPHPVARFVGGELTVTKLGSSFGHAALVLERTGEPVLYTVPLPAASWLGDAVPLRLVVELPPGGDPAGDVSTARRVTVHGVDGTPLASWSATEGFTADGPAWERLVPEGEGLVAGFFPPHIVLVDVAGLTSRLITPHGSVTPPRDSSTPEIERFLDEAAQALPDAAHLDLLGERLYRYVFDSPDPASPDLIGNDNAVGDIHQTVEQVVGRTMGGVCYGDCDDLAEVFQNIVRRQGRLGHIMSIPAHNAFCWAEPDAEGTWHAYVLQTGVPREFTGPDLEDVIRQAYVRFTGGQPFNPTSVAISLRFGGENQRGTWYLSYRIYGEPDYARLMIDVQRDWHYRTYHRGVVKMRQLLEQGDRSPANYSELAGLARATGEWGLSARYLEARNRATEYTPLQATLEHLAALFEAGKNDEARALVKPYAEVDLPRARRAGSEEFLDAALTAASVLLREDRDIDLGIKILEREVAPAVDRFVRGLAGWMRSEDFHPDAWNASPVILRVRQQLLSYVLVVEHCLLDEAIRSHIDEETLASICSPVNGWFREVAFQQDPGRGELLASYGLLGVYAKALQGEEAFHEALAAAPWAEPGREHGHARRGDVLEHLDEDLPWIRTSVLFWIQERGWLTREDVKTLDRERYLWASDQLREAYRRTQELGMDARRFEEAVTMSDLSRALVAEDPAALRIALAEVARQDDKETHDGAVSAIGSMARFLDLEWFQTALGIWDEVVGRKPGYFGIAWEAKLVDAPEHALSAARLGVQRFPEETAFPEELEALEQLLSGTGLAADDQAIPEPEVPRSSRAHPLGSLGTVLDLPSGWEFRRLAEEGPEGQFFREPYFFAMVSEIQGPFAILSDFETHPHFRMLQSREGFKALGPITFEPDVAGGHAWMTLSGRAGELDIVWCNHLVAQHGLAYGFMVWGPAEEQAAVEADATRLTSGLRFPGPDTEWGQRTRPRRHEEEVAGYTVSIEYRPTVLGLDEGDPGDTFMAFHSPDQTTALYLLLGAGTSGAAMLQETFGILAGEIKDLTPGEPKVLELTGLQLACREFTYDQGRGCGAVIAYPLANDRFLDIRFFSTGAIADRQAMLRTLLASIHVTTPEAVHAFPEVGVPDDPPSPLPAGWERLLEASTSLASLASVGSLRVLSPAELLVVGWDTLQAVSLEDGALRTIPTGEASSLGAIIVHGGEFLMPDTTNNVWRLNEGSWEKAGTTATALAPGGARGLLLTRRPSTPGVLGFPDLPAVSGERLILRRPDGSEQHLATLPPWAAVLRLTPGGGGEHVLATCQGSPSRGHGNHLFSVALATGKVSDRGRWEEVRSTGPSLRGWLVAGRPVQGEEGLHQLLVEGPPEPVISGGEVQYGLQSGPDEIAILLRRSPRRSTLLRLPLRVVRRHGPGCQPWNPPALRQLANEALASCGLEPTPLAILGRRQDLERFVDAATVAAQGQDLRIPLDDPLALDQLLAAVHDPERLGDEGTLLGTALFCQCLLRQGAGWVESRRTPGKLESLQLPVDDPMTLPVLVPHQAERSDPPPSAQRLLERAEGRQILLGLDPIQLRQRIESSEEEDLLTQARDRTVEELLAGLRANAGNRYRRQRLYRYLAAHDRQSVLREVALAFSRDPGTAHMIDTRAYLVARVHLETEPAAQAELVEELQNAIRSYPGEMTFYLLLGRVHERGPDPRADALARQCYRHVQTNESWSDVGTQAREALEALER